MTDNEIRAAWIWCQEIWPSYPLAEDPEERQVRLGIWQEIVGDLSADSVRAALVDLSAKEFPPPLGQIRELAELRDVSRRRDERYRQQALHAPVRAQDDPLTEHDRYVMSLDMPAPPPGDHYTPSLKRAERMAELKVQLKALAAKQKLAS